MRLRCMMTRSLMRRPRSAAGHQVNPYPSRPLGHVRASCLQTLQKVGHQGRDRAALTAGQRDVGEERVTLERLDDCSDTVMATDSQVVALRDVVGPVSYTHLRAHETVLDLVCRLLLEKTKT